MKVPTWLIVGLAEEDHVIVTRYQRGAYQQQDRYDCEFHWIRSPKHLRTIAHNLRFPKLPGRYWRLPLHLFRWMQNVFAGAKKFERNCVR